MTYPSARLWSSPRLRSPGIASCGRQWRQAARDSEIFQRRSEIADLAFALLGGGGAARAFLQGMAPDEERTMLETATASALGHLRVTHLLRKIAMHRMRPYQ